MNRFAVTARVTILLSGLLAAILLPIAAADGEVSMADATAFGEIFDGGGPKDRIDLNGDGQGNLADANTFGQMWQVWGGAVLGEKP